MTSSPGPDGRLAGKAALITGGASGIGLATVELFAAEGANVVFCDLPVLSEEELRDRYGPIGPRAHYSTREVGGPHDGHAIAARLGASVHFVPADVAIPDQLGNAVNTALERFGRLDVMFNNAGVGGNEGPLVDGTDEVFDHLIDINLRAVWRGTMLAAKAMIGQGGGAIVNTGSAGAVRAFSGAGIYGATKAAVIQLSRIAALELAAHHIRVNSVSPGKIMTSMRDRHPLSDGPARIAEELTAMYRDYQPLPVPGQAQYVAEAVLWLASDASQFVTGQDIAVDGGLSIVGDARTAAGVYGNRAASSTAVRTLTGLTI
jgi:NAD(P)-dependent dehydrogenase (short-subunit alcohol dehydrogenase family)